MSKALSGKGKPMKVYGGFVYTLERTTETKLSFRCKNRSGYINVATNRLRLIGCDKLIGRYEKKVW
jgi:hypothetical protein